MSVMECCQDAIGARLSRFYMKHGAVEDHCLCPHFRAECERVLPGLFELLERPGRWIGSAELPWFPVSPERIAGVSIQVRFIKARLPFVAAVLRIPCLACAQSHHLICLGANFYAFVSHFGAHLSGRGLDTRTLAQFIESLSSANPVWDDFPAPSAVPRDLVAYGMAWVMCHEMGHFASPATTRSDHFDVPDYARDHLVEECRADSMSCRILLMRALNRSMDSGDTALRLLAGIYLVLNAWNVLIPRSWDRQSDLMAYGDRVGAITPSPRLRWQMVCEPYDVMANLNILSNPDLLPADAHLFSTVQQSTYALQELLDVY